MFMHCSHPSDNNAHTNVLREWIAITRLTAIAPVSISNQTYIRRKCFASYGKTTLLIEIYDRKSLVWIIEACGNKCFI